MNLKSLEFVRVETAERVAEISLDRPKALNAINRRMMSELEFALDELRRFDSLAALIVTGSGDRAFAAGVDVGEIAEMTANEALELARQGHRMLENLATFPVPVLAAVNGFALGGGCELALSCDIVLASETAKFGQPEVKLGLIPGFGGCVRLPRKAGMSIASQWIFTGQIFNAQQAKEAGLVSEILPATRLMSRVREIAKTISRRSPRAVRAAKHVIVQGLGANPAAAASIEQLSFSHLFDSSDPREGCAAFLEKRDPDFSGE